MMCNLSLVNNRQKGIVLFIALIALVVMSLASVALIRSVDTNTRIAGNLSFQQSALTSADRGLESAIAWLNTQNLANLNASVAAQAYFADYGDLDDNGVRDSVIGNLAAQVTLKDTATWNAFSAKATGVGIDDGEEADTGNTIRYVIERMCEEELPPAKDTTNKCLLGSSESGGDSSTDADTEAIQTRGNGDSINPIYRVTVRVTGPKNTESYTQAYVY